MFLVELVMQGVRGFQQLARLRFQGGFNFVAAGNEAGKTTAVDTIVRLLFPDSRPDGMESLVSRPAPEASRGALVVYSDDGAYYRVIQDFSKRAVNLSKYNAATKDFALVNKDWDSTSQFMASLLPGISEEDYARLFVFRRDACTGQPAPSPASQAAPATAFQPKANPASSGRTAAQEARLAELRETLRKAEEAADAEYKLDAAKMRLGELAKKLETLAESDNRFADIDAQIADLQGCSDLPEDLAELISVHEEQQGRKMAKSDELQQDMETLKMQIESVPQANLLIDKLFLGGVAVGALSVIAGLFILTADQAVFFPLGIFGSLLLVAAGWYNSSRKNAQRKVVEKEIEDLEKELADLEKSFQEGGATILKCMQATGSSTAAELKEKAENYRYFRSLRDDLDEQRRLILGGQAAEALQAAYAAQQEEVALLGKAAAALARYSVDTYSVRQEIDRIESEMPAAAGQDFGGFFGGDDPGGEVGAPVQPAAVQQVNFLADIALASRMGGIEMETLVPAAEAAAQRNLSAVSGGKYVRIEVGHDGRPVVHDKNNEQIAFAELSHGTRELVCFCLRAGIVEAVAGKRRLPFVLDDPFTGFDFSRQQAACQILRVLGAKTQVILFTSNPALKAATDVAVELK